jgi:error-prone DNA polymerase
VLGITAVDPAEHRPSVCPSSSHLSAGEPPDIDVDFEHERREEVIQHIYERYGRDRAGMPPPSSPAIARAAPCARSGKVLGLTEDVTARWPAPFGAVGGFGRRRRRTGNTSARPALIRTTRSSRVLDLPSQAARLSAPSVPACRRLRADPRPARREIVPIGNAAMKDRTFIEWDKDDIDALGLMKVDVLALGMLTCIRKCLDLIKEHCGMDSALGTTCRAKTRRL